MIRIRPLKRAQTLKDMAYEQVKGLLRTGKMSCDAIYSANHLADRLGVSRTPVREALLQLSAEGFLTTLGSKGFRVRRYTREEVEDTFEARQAIERWVVEQLAARKDFDPTELGQAFDLMAEAAATGDSHGFMEADERFHLALVRAQGNALLAAVMENIRDRISVLGHQALAVQGRMAEVLEEHRRIAGALKRGGPAQASAAMAEHLDATRRNLLRDFAEEEKGADASHRRTA